MARLFAIGGSQHGGDASGLRHPVCGGIYPSGYRQLVRDLRAGGGGAAGERGGVVDLREHDAGEGAPTPEGPEGPEEQGQVTAANGAELRAR